jgi:hypothetical protein
MDRNAPDCSVNAALIKKCSGPKKVKRNEGWGRGHRVDQYALSATESTSVQHTLQIKKNASVAEMKTHHELFSRSAKIPGMRIVPSAKAPRRCVDSHG